MLPVSDAFNPTLLGCAQKKHRVRSIYKESTYEFPKWNKMDSDGYVDLYNADGEHVASYIDGEVVPVSDDEEEA